MSSESPWVVIKFGGTSVSSRSSWETIAKIVQARIEEGVKPLVVCSALSGISDEIERLLSDAERGEPGDAMQRIRARHTELAAELSIDVSVIGEALEELERLATGASLIREVSPRLRARVMAQGEIMSTKLGAAFLTKLGVDAAWQDAREHLLAVPRPMSSAAQCFLHASCASDPEPAVAERLASIESKAVLTQGFIARDDSGDTVLLGRGGSDVSAAYLAAKLAARRCEIWTDVPGMYTANPRMVPTAHLLKTLDYDEAQEIASSGAKVLHPRCLAPVRKNKIPLSVHWLERPDFQGTVISDRAGSAGAQVKAISSRGGVTLVSMETVDMWQQVGFLARAFDCFRRHSISIDLVSTSETNVTVTLDRAVNAADSKTLNALAADLNAFCNARIVEPCAFVSLVGRDIRAILHKIAPALEAFEEQRVYMVSQAANDLNLTFVVDEEQAAKLVGELHNSLFSQRKKSSILGPTWSDISEKARCDSRPAAEPWWKKRRRELIDIASRQTPLYVYDMDSVDRRIADLRSLKSADKLFYSVKANPHPAILTRVHDAGIGFECVSPGEIDHVLSLFKGMDASRVIFTPNFASRQEYEKGLAAGVFVTLDNLFPLRQWPGLFEGRNIFVRIDPGKGKGHHEFVHTAGHKSKFGISPDQLDELADLAHACKAKISGLHAHVGSNIFDSQTWAKTAAFLAGVAERFPDAKVLDVGGGLGVVEKPGTVPLDMAATEAGLSAVKKAHPAFEIWIEPGRFIAAEAGVLLAKCTQIKRKGDYCYVGVDTGMNSLIRPALYGSYHEIVNLTRLGDEPDLYADIVGPICESGDVLGYDRRLAEPSEGDVLLIATAGAYGRAMSSSYNMRQPAGELALDPAVKT